MAVLSQNALKIATSRYFMDGEDWEGCCKRVASVISSVETNEKSKYMERFFDIIYNLEFLPGGRILRNSGRPRGSLFNCYHLGIGDSIEEIGDFLKNALVLWSEGGGVGCTFSSLRPKGDAILGKGGRSSGLVSFITAADAVARTIESGGSRRAAAIALVDISHPEVLDFIDSKLVDGILSTFNISVSVNEDFLSAVESDDLWTFKFKQKEYGKVKARDIWQKIVHNMVTCAEPGLINWDNFSKNNSYYFMPVKGTNPCGETTLAAGEACDLGSIVLPKFVTKNTNWRKLEEVIRLAVRFLDNVIDVNNYSLKEIDINVHKTRRIGLGVLGLAEYLFAKGVRYGSPEAVAETERLMRFIRDTVYQASVEIAVEKGSFPMFDPIAYGKAHFIRTLPASIRMDIKKFGIRNCTLMALAPTGTISLLADYSSGIEPLFSKAYKRSDRVGDRLYVHPLYEDYLKNNVKIPHWFVDSFDLTPKDHFEIQVACQKFVDGSVSKTINVPKDFTEEGVSDLLLEYLRDLKGVTIYRDQSRKGQVLNSVSKEEVIQYLKQEKKTDFEQVLSCSTGKCDL